MPEPIETILRLPGILTVQSARQIIGRVAQGVFLRAVRRGRADGHVILTNVGPRRYRLRWCDTREELMETNEHPNSGDGYAISQEQIGGEPITIMRTCRDGRIENMDQLCTVLQFRLAQLRRVVEDPEAPAAVEAETRTRIQELELLLAVIAGPTPA